MHGTEVIGNWRECMYPCISRKVMKLPMERPPSLADDHPLRLACELPELLSAACLPGAHLPRAPDADPLPRRDAGLRLAPVRPARLGAQRSVLLPLEGGLQVVRTVSSSGSTARPSPGDRLLLTPSDQIPVRATGVERLPAADTELAVKPGSGARPA